MNDACIDDDFVCFNLFRFYCFVWFCVYCGMVALVVACFLFDELMIVVGIGFDVYVCFIFICVTYLKMFLHLLFILICFVFCFWTCYFVWKALLCLLFCFTLALVLAGIFALICAGCLVLLFTFGCLFGFWTLVLSECLFVYCNAVIEIL